MHALAWEIMLYPKAVPRSCVLDETALNHLLLAVALPSVPLPRVGISTGCASIFSASSSPHPQELLKNYLAEGETYVNNEETQHHFCDKGALDPLKGKIRYGPTYSDTVTEEG